MRHFYEASGRSECARHFGFNVILKNIHRKGDQFMMERIYHLIVVKYRTGTDP